MTERGTDTDVQGREVLLCTTPMMSLHISRLSHDELTYNQSFGELTCKWRLT